MSLHLPGNGQYQTQGNVTTLDGASAFTVSLFFRYDGNPASASSWQWLGHQFQVPFLCRFAGGTSGRVNLYFGARDSAGSLVSTTTSLSVGIVYHLALAWAPGSQLLYVNGIPQAIGGSANALASASPSRPWLLGVSGGVSDLTFGVNQLALWRNQALTAANITALRDGTQTPLTLGASAYWSFSTPGKAPGDAVALGDSGLNEVNGQTLMKWASLSGTAAAYSDPMPFVPSTACAAKVTTCGGMVSFDFASKFDGSPVNPIALYTAPTLSVNGVSRGALLDFNLTLDGRHSKMLGRIPGARLGVNDVATLAGALGWMASDAGLAESMTGQTVENCVGRSFLRDESLTPTMKIGQQFGHLGFPEYGTYPLAKNQRYRIGFWNPSVVAQDASGKPTTMGGTSALGPIIDNYTSNGMDGTGYPTPTGYWCIACKDATADFALVKKPGNANTTITEVPGLANLAPGPGLLRARVFDVQPAVGATTSFLTIYAQVSKADSQPDMTDFTVLAPGDFAYTPGQPVEIAAPLPYDLPSALTARCPTTLPYGAFRFGDQSVYFGGGSVVSQPEHRPRLNDWHYSQDVKRSATVRFTQARPWTGGYIYTPLFGSPFNCTLAANITTSPAPGTLEVITISDAATAPVLVGLVLLAGSERMRVMAVSGTSVTVERGSERTTPTTHAAGTIQALNRLNLATLAAIGPNNQQATELVCQDPHGLETGMTPTFSPDGWPMFLYTDGRTSYPVYFGRWRLPIFITGSNTFITIFKGPDSASSPPNTTLATTYALDPADCFYQIYWPEFGGAPYEWQAHLANQYPGAALWLQTPMAGSNSLIDAIGADIFPVLGDDHPVYLEHSNEPWNGSERVYPWFFTADYLNFGSVGTQARWVARRTGQTKARLVAVRDSLGKSNPVKALLNLQTSAAGNIGTLLDQALSDGNPIDAVALAPYLFVDTAGGAGIAAGIQQAYAQWSTDQLVDLWIWDLYSNTRGDGWAARFQAFRAALDAWNSAHAAAVELLIYEYAPQIPWPVLNISLTAAVNDTTNTWPVSSTAGCFVGQYLACQGEWAKVTAVGTNTVTVDRHQSGTAAASHGSGAAVRNDWIEGTRDLTLYPSMRIATKDFFAFAQSYGATLLMPSSHNQDWSSGTAWGTSHGWAQLPGKGDGSDGRFDNRLCLARPGPAQKAATVNQDANTVSVRAQAEIEWNGALVPESSGLRYFHRLSDGNDTGLLDFVCRLDLTADTFDFSAVKADGSDLRVIDFTTGAPLPYWLCDFNPVARTGRLYFRAADTSHDNRLYYSDPAAASASDFAATFDAGTGFDADWGDLTAATSGGGHIPRLEPFAGGFDTPRYRELYTRSNVPAVDGSTDLTTRKTYREFSLLTDRRGKIVQEGGLYVAYYIRQNAINASAVHSQTWRCTSADGVTWTNHTLALDANPTPGAFDDIGARVATVIKYDVGDYRMWYTANSSNGALGGVGYATSTDGLTFGNRRSVMNSGNSGITDVSPVFLSGVPDVLQIADGRWIMHNESRGGASGYPWRVYGWSSPDATDGGTWTPLGGGAALIGQSNGMTTWGAANPHLCEAVPGERFLLFSQGFSGSSSDLTTFNGTPGFFVASDVNGPYTFDANGPVAGRLNVNPSNFGTETSGLAFFDDGSWMVHIQDYPDPDNSNHLAKVYRLYPVLDRCGVYNAPSATDAAIASMVIPSTGTLTLENRCGMTAHRSGDNTVYCLGLADSATAVAPDTTTNIIAKLRVAIRRTTFSGNQGTTPSGLTPGSVSFLYWDSGSTIHYWTGSAWSTTSSEACQTECSKEIMARIDDDGTDYRFVVHYADDLDGAPLAEATIAKSSVKAFSAGRATVSGVPFTNANYGGGYSRHISTRPYAAIEPDIVMGESETPQPTAFSRWSVAGSPLAWGRLNGTRLATAALDLTFTRWQMAGAPLAWGRLNGTRLASAPPPQSVPFAGFSRARKARAAAVPDPDKATWSKP